MRTKEAQPQQIYWSKHILFLSASHFSAQSPKVSTWFQHDFNMSPHLFLGPILLTFHILVTYSTHLHPAPSSMRFFSKVLQRCFGASSNILAICGSTGRRLAWCPASVIFPLSSMPRNTIAGNMENMDAEKDWRIRQGMIYGGFFSVFSHD